MNHPAKRSRQRCRICNGVLTVHQEVSGRVCDDLHCKRSAVVQDAARRHRAEAERLERAALAWRDRVLAQGPQRTGAPHALAVLPSNGRSLGPLPARRRRAIRDHLAALVEEAIAEGPAKHQATTEEPTPGVQVDASERALLALGCATCRGYCCCNGGDHAYLDVPTMRRYMAEHPGAGEADVVQAYLSYLPQTSYRGSCTFHGRWGCTLPREMRAQICNDFHCTGLQNLRQQLASGREKVFAVATSSGELLRAAVFDRNGIERRLRRERKPSSQVPGPKSQV